MIICPKCSESMPLYQAIEMPELQILSEIGKWIELIFTIAPIYPICDICDSVRCVAGAVDFWLCITCSSVICPLCALDFHRSHCLIYGYLAMITNSMPYWRKLVLPIMMFEKVSSELRVFLHVFDNILTCVKYFCVNFQNYKSKIATAVEIVENCRKFVNDVTHNIEKIIQTAKTMYSHQILTTSQYITDQERNEIVNVFTVLIETLREPININLKYIKEQSKNVS